MKKAEQAIQQGNDDAARKALTYYNDIVHQAKRYQQQQKEQEQLVVTMRSALRQLEVKIAEVETTIDLLVARKRNALIQQRVFDALNKNGGAREKERTSRAQDAVFEAEARARALAELHKSDLDTQLDNLSGEQMVERQLQDLKAHKHLSPETPLLHEGNSQVSPLLQPQPQASRPAKKRTSGDAKVTGPLSSGPSRTDDAELTRLKKLLETPLE
jgi:phage shock protein A